MLKRIFEKDALIIGTQWDLPPDEIPKDRIIKQINYPGGLPAFLFVETKVK
jgi:hypothetical protein